jgi:hypothetical protein
MVDLVWPGLYDVQDGVVSPKIHRAEMYDVAAVMDGRCRLKSIRSRSVEERSCNGFKKMLQMETVIVSAPNSVFTMDSKNYHNWKLS